LASFLLLALQLNGGIFLRPGARGSFYAVIPHAAMAAPFLAASAWILCAFGVGVARFWRGLPAKPQRVSLPAAAAEAAQSALTLRNLDGGGAGCNEASDAPTPWRRRFHHAAFYGFMLCFASTCVATWYHYVLKLQAPYPWTSVPVLLGSVGGIGLLAGTAGLLWLHAQRHPDLGDRTQRPMDVGFMTLLFATSLTGLLLLIFRDGAAMPLLLAVHLGVVAAFFITLPYGKFAHAVYRVAALVKDAIEKRQPNTIVLKLD
jgi:citrate/tricarballylate utilization protein